MDDPFAPYLTYNGIPVDERTDGPGVRAVDPGAPASPLYILMSRFREPLALRDIMIAPVRTGYIGQDRPIDPADIPPSAEALFPDVSVRTIFVPSDAGPVRCGVYTPPHAKPGALCLYVHGGGFTVGQFQDTAYITSRIAAENGVVVVSLNYRLAPEWPFPAGLDDTMAVYRFLVEEGEALSGGPTRLMVAGDSAGGNFAAAVVVRARDEGLRIPDAAVLLSPVTDLVFEDHAAFEARAPTGFIYDTAFMGFVRGAYAVKKSNWTHPHVSPLRADLSGFSPTLIVTGGVDPLLDENRAFAEKLVLSDVTPVEHYVAEGQDHGFYFFHKLVPEGDVTFAKINAFLTRALS